MVYDKHPEGVAQVFFSSALEADAAIAAVDGRMFFNGNVMKASTWDGKTKYKVREREIGSMFSGFLSLSVSRPSFCYAPCTKMFTFLPAK